MNNSSDQCNNSCDDNQFIKLTKWKVTLAADETIVDQPAVYNNNIIRYNIWDFKENEIYHQTQSLFLKDRSLYLLLIDLSYSEIKQRNIITQWLNILPKNSRVILIATKIDKIKENFKSNSEFTTSQDYIDHLSKNIVDYYAKISSNITNYITISLKDYNTIEELSNLIIKQTLESSSLSSSSSSSSQFNDLKKLYPFGYITLEKLLQSERKLNPIPVLSIDQFERILLSCSIEGSMQTITDLCTSLGLIYSNFSSISVVCIDIKWFISIISKLINEKKEYISKGYLYHSNLRKIFPEYLESFYSQFIFILASLELIYSSPTDHHNHDHHHQRQQQQQQLSLINNENESYSIIPSLLDSQKPSPLINAKWISVDEFCQISDGIQLERLYQFTSTPQFGFFSRLIVRLLHFTTPLVMWKNGILCRRGTDESLIEYQSIDHEISVKVRGKNPSALLRLIIENLNLLISGWYGNMPKILIPLAPNQMKYHKLLEQPIFTLEELETAASFGRTQLPLGDSFVSIESIAPDLLLFDMKDLILPFDHLEILQLIGEGGFGKVFKAKLKNQIVAVKQVIVDDQFKVEAFREFRREVALSIELKQPNIVELLAVCLDPWCLVLEFLEFGDLYSFLHNPANHISWRMRLKMAQNIAEAIRFLHQFQPKIIHRDLKSPNCLMASIDPNAEIIVKVTDFGESRAVATSYAGRDRLQNPVWLAPEIMKKEQYSEKADVFSFGIILWELLCRFKPYDEYEVSKSAFVSHLEDAIIDGLRPSIPENCPPKYKELIQECWHSDPKVRPNFEKICQRIYSLQSNYNSLKNVGITTSFYFKK